MHPPSMLRTVCLAALVAVAACESATDTPAREGRFTFSWGGKQFEGNAQAEVYGDSLYLRGSSPGGAMSPLEVSVTVADFQGPGEYALGPAAGVMRYILGGDVITGTYSIPPAETGTLVVTAVSGETVTGRVEFDADAHAGSAPAGTRARFQGEFQAKLVRPRP
ncbi:MAG TPA: hypothetical protein VE871_06855 [Longimicrobium sp.]|nr:hypothetical protein [Longimicrobium sp.]